MTEKLKAVIAHRGLEESDMKDTCGGTRLELKKESHQKGDSKSETLYKKLQNFNRCKNLGSKHDAMWKKRFGL